ncbi:MAG: polyphosphate polymerase domain-containing protein [Polyangiaceae bacterium]|nr:polyphosphate polymerase domain-containing protein [Polyangiaceae bacterium]
MERYEYKYLIPERLVPAIRAAARTTCRLDEHAKAGGSYAIRSLYLDTDRYHLYWANEREQRDRFKARIRTYPGKPAPVFFEIKRRVGDVIVKTRAAVPEPVWVQGLADPSSISLPPHAKKGLERFYMLAQTYHLKPRVLVEYDREAYVSVVDNYARLTFDRRIVCQAKDAFDLTASPSRWRAVDHPAKTQTPEPVCVLELKFERVPPRWMVDLVKRLELVRLSFSKYCYSVDALLLLPMSRAPRFAGGSPR